MQICVVGFQAKMIHICTVDATSTILTLNPCFGWRMCCHQMSSHVRKSQSTSKYLNMDLFLVTSVDSKHHFLFGMRYGNFYYDHKICMKYSHSIIITSVKYLVHTRAQRTYVIYIYIYITHLFVLAIYHLLILIKRPVLGVKRRHTRAHRLSKILRVISVKSNHNFQLSS